MVGLGPERWFVRGLVALFVLGPERLPAAAAWLGRRLSQVRSLADKARQRLHDELGPEFDELREPLAQLRGPLQGSRALRDPRPWLAGQLLNPPSPTTIDPRAPTSARAPDHADSTVIGFPPGTRAFDPDAT